MGPVFFSLRRLILLGGLAFSGLLLAALLGLLSANVRMHQELEAATASFVTEQRMADQLTRSVFRQLVIATQFAAGADPRLLDRFREPGDEAAALFRGYLFRDLSPTQRLELERMKESHQRLEVAANEAYHLVARGRREEAEGPIGRMATHSVDLQESVDRFLAMRQEDLARLQARQAEVADFLHRGAIVITLLLVLVTLLFGRLLYRRIARPLDLLGDAADRIGRGDLHVRVDLHDGDEFSRLGRAFNAMAGNLAAARHDLEERNRELSHAFEELHTAQDELIQSEKMSATGRMLAGLAHELNNPLATVLGSAQLLQRSLDDADGAGPPSIAELRENVDPLVTEAQRARELVHNLLTFSRKARPSLHPVRVKEALDVAVALAGPSFARASLDIRTDVDADLAVHGDPQRLQQIFLNLLTNARDAMEDHGGAAVQVTGHAEGDSVVLEIRDDGPGLPDPDRVFEPFYTTKPVGAGTGLGLALVHGFVGEFGGQITAANCQDAGGACFVIRLRRAHMDGDTPAAGPGRGHLEPAPGLPAGPGETAGHTRILVVEDEPPLRKLQARLLRRLGADVVTAESGNQARKILGEGSVDLVISDIRMSDGDGLSLFRWLRDHDSKLAEVMLFVTGDVGGAQVGELAELPDQRFLAKPFQVHEYVERVRHQLAEVAPAELR